MDIVGPCAEGLPVTDRTVANHQRPKYMLLGAFVPFGQAEAKARYEQEVSDRQAAGQEGPVQMETMTRPESQTMYFVELIPSKKHWRYYTCPGQDD